MLALFVIGLFVFSGHYAAIYNSPAVRDGKADFAEIDLPTRDVACNLAGEWAFYYNQWIVTDGSDAQPDGMIRLPGLWTYKNYGNGVLPRTGFASYRLRVENVQPNVDVIVYRTYGDFAYRVFINGQLNYRSGILSKDVGETVVTGRADERNPYRTDGSPLEIVIEVSAANTGGFHAAPWLAATSAGISYGTGLRSYNYIVLGITAAAVAVSILTYALFRYKRDITVPACMLALFAHFMCSKDMLYVVRWRIPVAVLFQLLTAISAFVLLIWHLRRNGVALKKMPAVIASAAASALTALLIAFYGTPLAPVFAAGLMAIGCGFLVPLVFCSEFNPILRGVYGVLFVFLLSVFGFELCDGLGLLVFGTEFIFSFELMLMIACFAVLWLWKLADTARTAIRVGELECELAAVKNKALRAQIKPHFIYNSLTAIQGRYRVGMNEGDRAIERFAKHLRLITDSDGEDMIPFDDEVRNVLNYFELENLRAYGKLNLLLDLEYTDFSVPVLSIQPLVENAIKHGGLRQKPESYIALSSSKTDRAIVITVSDNGSGFDVGKVHEGVGIENTRKRFELMRAEMRIDSHPDCGTQVTIEIPLERAL